MFESIVVGTDGSAGALEAVAVAGAIARSFGTSDVHVVAAHPVYSSPDVLRIRAALPDDTWDPANLDADTDQHLSRAGSVLHAAGIHPISHKVAGDPATAILQVADRVDADLIVVGARGLGAVGRFLRGSVSTRVAHHSPCSVLIVEHDG